MGSLTGSSMQAMVYTRYGPPSVLHLRELPVPTPAAGEVRVRVQATSINAADWHLLTADIFLARLHAGLLAPRRPILGADVAGQVEAVGPGVIRFRPGDRVFGAILNFNAGAFAEYVCVPERFLEPIPRALGFEDAAAVPLAAISALQGLRNVGGLQPGQQVLIQGASGGVGTFAVQVARLLGAEVTAVCSTRNVEQAHQLGAHHVVDYRKQHIATLEKKFDLVLAVNGHHPMSVYQKLLTPQGRYVMLGGQQAQIFEALLFASWRSRKDGQQFLTTKIKPSVQDLTLLSAHLQNGTLVPVVDRKYPLKDLVQAMEYFGEGHARGKVVITV